MNLRDQLQNINSSAVALTVAQAYLVGALVPITTMVLPRFITSDFVEAAISFGRDCLGNTAWDYLFIKASLNSGISFSLGALMRTNAFDQFRSFFPSASKTTPPTLTPGPKTQDSYDK